MQTKNSMANFVFKVRRQKIQKFRNCNNAIYRVQIRLNFKPIQLFYRIKDYSRLR